MEETIKKVNLTEDDIDVLSGMMIIFLHAAERCIRIIELHYEAEYRASSDYKKLCKLYGKINADAIVGEYTKKIYRGDEKNKLGRLLKIGKEYMTAIESLTESAMKSHNNECTDIDAFDSIQHDVNFLCYAYANMVNCIGKDDELKILSTIKLLAKGTRVTERVLEKLNYKI